MLASLLGFMAGGFVAARVLDGLELPGKVFLGWTALALALGVLLGQAVLLAGLAWWRRQTAYGLTADAAVVRTPLGTTVIALGTGTEVALSLGTRDMGTITFGRGPAAPAFRHVRHARHVFDLARGASPEDPACSPPSTLPPA